ncbi:hypothetical protein [Rhodopirellula sp. MGV]|uniref:hypothetical protein n=1 Tax=Rhodopirellula sp. MGV TaxID=2023130 RepID=UPI000B95CF8A|nr:hypothetical protein [Rhodopirellula sp. MGV]OYP32204.1 hypothetical protein CGZ80_20340 [Rhodopirellula sp. MGV]PNY35557.1 hypothetical protein C2E31_18890 [Rhodopirellula baltica]
MSVTFRHVILASLLGVAPVIKAQEPEVPALPTEPETATQPVDQNPPAIPAASTESRDVSSVDSDASEQGDEKMKLSDFLDPEKLPVDADGNREKSWPIETLQKFLRGKLQIGSSSQNVPNVGIVTYSQYSQSGSTSVATRPVRASGLNTLAYASVDQMRAAMSREVANEIRKWQKQVKQTKEDDQAKAIDRLAFLFRLRFDLDTAYQDLKVSEIEQRAKKLRDDVERREAAVDKWVEAKVTLEQMRADGIEGNSESTSDIMIYGSPYTPAVFPNALPTPPTAPLPASRFGAPPSQLNSNFQSR